MIVTLKRHQVKMLKTNKVKLTLNDAPNVANYNIDSPMVVGLLFARDVESNMRWQCPKYGASSRQW
jgi:hypothetical protein